MRTNHLSPISSRRGAARISAVWMIVVVILLFIVLFYAYVAQDGAATTERARATAVKAQADADGRLADARKDVSTRSAILGFTTDAATQPSNLEAAGAALTELKDSFPDMEAVSTFQAAVPAVKAAYATQAKKIAALDTRIKELTAEVESVREAKSSAEDTLEATVATLRQEKDDIETTLQGNIDRLEEANGTLRSQVNSSGDKITTLEDQVRVEQRNALETGKELSSVKVSYAQRLNDINRRSEKPDGEISAVLPAEGIGFINLSASDRLSEGTEFDIVGGSVSAGKGTRKARGRVVDVGTRFSEVLIYDVVDPLGQPVVQGDKIYNPLYEAKGERNAVLAGNISGAYNEPELRALFKEIGINVQDAVSNTTDFLITGGPMYTDADGEPLEEPMQPEDLPVYGEARDRGVLVIPVRDVMQYFRK